MGRILTIAVLLLSAPGGACARVLVVGLDGADWRVIDPLVEAGHLPTIAEILARSARSRMDCEPAWPIFSCYCPPVWNTMSTGQPRDVHGITQADQPASERRVPTVWNLAAAFGQTSILLNYRNTFPVDEGVTFMLGEPAAHWAAWQAFHIFGGRAPIANPAPFQFPDTLAQDLGVITPPPAGAWWEPFAIDEIALRVLAELARRDLYADLTILLVHGTDKAGHVNWGLVQDAPELPLKTDELLAQAASWTPPTSGFGSVASQYLMVDRFLGSLDLARWDQIVFLSDHGMTRNFGALSGDHGPGNPSGHTGIFSVGGAGVRVRTAPMYRTTVLDVAPTLAFMLGLPIARDLPGRAQRRFFDVNFRRAHRRPRVDSWAEAIATAGTQLEAAVTGKRRRERKPRRSDQRVQG